MVFPQNACAVPGTALAKANAMRVLLVALLCGCGPLVPAESTLGISSDGRSFQAAEPGQKVALIAGPQGGFHIFVHLRARGLDESVVDLRNHSVAADGEEINFARSRDLLRPMAPSDGQWLELAQPMLTQLCPTAIRVADRLINFEITATDPSGHQATQALSLTPVCPTAPEERAWCERICTGN
jgi:hypothetical protein